MKKSNYNLIRNINGNNYIINLLSSKFIKLNDEQLAMLNKDDFSNLDFKNMLINDGMLIDDDYNEIDYLKKRYKEDQVSKDLLTITIAPTLRCNFKCPYCYENRNGKIIDKQSQEKIIKFIRKQVKKGYKKLNLIWFGGEPLLVFDIIKEMSDDIIDICENYNVEYNAFMTTNGYLFTDEIISELAKYNINQLFVTLDGPKTVHDSRRSLCNNGETFDVITENLRKLKEKNINTIIRMNIDRSNYGSIEKLRKYVTNELGFPMYLGLVRQYTDSCTKDNIYFNKKQYAMIQDEFEENMSKDKDIDFSLPRQRCTYCRACKVGTFVIDPDLNLFKCENDIGRSEKRVSTIDEYELLDELNEVNNKDYYQWNPFEYKKCIECELLPICMGGCPYVGIKNNNTECEIYKYNIDNVVKKHILKHNSKSGLV